MVYRFVFNPTTKLFHVILWNHESQKWDLEDQKWRLEDMSLVHSNLFNWSLKF